MRYAAAVLGLCALATASPLPAADAQPSGGLFPAGFPNPTAAQTKQIEQQAFGTLPNTPLPASLSSGSITTLQLIAFNEIFEVAYFHQLLNNVTSKVKGYDIADSNNYTTIVKTLKAIVGQEELHALGANAILKNVGATTIQPCTKYMFPVSDFASAIKLAGTFTSVVLGTLQDAVETFASTGDAPVARLITSVVGQEGEQEGWFRLLQEQIPNELPFLTTSAGPFAFTAVQGFVDPASCPSLSTIKVPTLKKLTVVDTPTNKDQTIRYSIPAAGYTSGEKMYLTYINQQNAPITEPATFVSNIAGTVTFSAAFPYTANELNGLTIASLSSCTGPYANVSAVAAEADYGPGLIIVQPE